MLGSLSLEFSRHAYRMKRNVMMSISIGGSLFHPRAIKLSILSDINWIAKHDIQTIKSIGAQGNKRFFAFTSK